MLHIIKTDDHLFNELLICHRKVLCMFLLFCWHLKDKDCHLIFRVLKGLLIAFASNCQHLWKLLWGCNLIGIQKSKMILISIKTNSRRFIKVFFLYSCHLFLFFKFFFLNFSLSWSHPLKQPNDLEQFLFRDGPERRERRGTDV